MTTALSNRNKSLGRWYWVHKWSSLLATVFILIACVTGLPLVFHDEIDGIFGSHGTVEMQGQSELDFDALISKAEIENPGLYTQFIFREAANPGITVVGLGETLDAPLEEGLIVQLSNYDGSVIGAQAIYDGFMGFMAQLHIELMGGQMGTFFLGLMTLFLMASIVSGVVLYAPFMGNRDFMIVRPDGSKKRRWFDLHNSLGMILMVWLMVVSFTGALNTIGAPLIQMWLMTDMKTATQHDMKGSIPEGAKKASFQSAYELAQTKLPDTDFYFAMFPGTDFSSDRHYLIFNTGREPLSSRMFQPVIVNAYTGEFVSQPEFPFYLKALLLSQPLHFGDYGGLSLKIAWAALDIGAIILLWSGLIVWWRKRNQKPEFKSPTAEAVPAE